MFYTPSRIVRRLVLQCTSVGVEDGHGWHVRARTGYTGEIEGKNSYTSLPITSVKGSDLTNQESTNHLH